MTYDSKTYGNSPFGNSGTPSTSTPEPLSDQGEPANPAAEAALPELPADIAPALKVKQRGLPRFYLPHGRLTGLNLIGEAAGWLMAWGTVGFFRSYIPAPVLTIFDQGFTPWGMAAVTLVSVFLIGQVLERYHRKMATLRQLATTAIEYGKPHHQADVQAEVDDLLRQAEAHTDAINRWLVSWLTALGCLFIIGSFY
ncbi:MAG: hypothetical protein AAFV90_24640 [Cyanobacteria bacterium J06634_5]